MTAWRQVTDRRWESTDGRLAIVRTTHQTSRRPLDLYEVTFDGKPTCAAALTLTVAQGDATRLLQGRQPRPATRRKP